MLKLKLMNRQSYAQNTTSECAFLAFVEQIAVPWSSILHSGQVMAKDRMAAGIWYLAIPFNRIQCALDLIDWLRTKEVPIKFTPRTIFILLLPHRMQLNCIFRGEQCAISKDFHACTHEHVAYINHKHPASMYVGEDDEAGMLELVAQLLQADSSPLLFSMSFHSFKSRKNYLEASRQQTVNTIALFLKLSRMGQGGKAAC